MLRTAIFIGPHWRQTRRGARNSFNHPEYKLILDKDLAYEIWFKAKLECTYERCGQPTVSLMAKVVDGGDVCVNSRCAAHPIDALDIQAGWFSWSYEHVLAMVMSPRGSNVEGVEIDFG